jgi:hypothetical protein
MYVKLRKYTENGEMIPLAESLIARQHVVVSQLILKLCWRLAAKQSSSCLSKLFLLPSPTILETFYWMLVDT